MVVPHDDERWVQWAAAGLARLSRVWGCSGSVVVPSSAVGHPAVDRCLARLHPDHVVAYGPSWTTFDALYPGTIDRLLAEKNISDNSIAAQFKEMLRKEPWNGPAVHEAEAAADSLRSRLGANRRDDHVQCSHLFDDDNARELTPLAAVATTPVMGVPATLVTTPEALAYAMHVGIEASDASGDIPAEQWREAALRGAESALLSQLHPDGADGAHAARSHEAALCVPITRAFQHRERIAVLGNRPEDFALAETLRQIRGAVTWIPWTEAGLSDMWLFPGRASERLLVTSAPGNIDLAHPFMVVLKNAWDQPRSLPATVESDGSLQTSLSLAAEVPRGLNRREGAWEAFWQHCEDCADCDPSGIPCRTYGTLW